MIESLIPLPLLPLVLVSLLAIAVLLLGVTVRDQEWVPMVTLSGLLATILISGLAIWHKAGPTFQYLFDRPDSSVKLSLVVDNFSLFFYILCAACAAVAVVTAKPFLKEENLPYGEFHSLILLALAGMMVMVSGTDLITIFLGLETMSLAVYVLVGFRRRDLKGNEGALKYFFLGAFAAGILLYGLALVYGATGTLNLWELQKVLQSGQASPLLVVGVALMLVGLGFKVAAVPFHMWTPDVYEGAPTAVTGFMATAVKAASFAVILRVFLMSFVAIKGEWVEVAMFLAMATMFIGNFLALVQTNIKRMLAYSSIAHTGYLLVGIAALSQRPDSSAASAVLVYLAAYAVASLAAFACISFLAQKGEQVVEISQYAGVGQRYPLVALVLALSMASFIGLPPTAGFFGKYYLFSAAIDEGFVLLAVVGIINSVLSIYYYLKVIVALYLQPVKRDWQSVPGPALKAVLLGLGFGIIWMGMGTFGPGVESLLAWAQLSIASLFGAS